MFGAKQAHTGRRRRRRKRPNERRQQFSFGMMIIRLDEFTLAYCFAIHYSGVQYYIILYYILGQEACRESVQRICLGLRRGEKQNLSVHVNREHLQCVPFTSFYNAQISVVCLRNSCSLARIELKPNYFHYLHSHYLL